MEDAYAVALVNSTYMKEHDKEKKLQEKQYLDKLKQGDKLLVKKVTPRGSPGKLRPY